MLKNSKMFSFFTKKQYLVDLLNGFVDIHNHILPGIDDGAKNVEESIALLKSLDEFGVKSLICTPHIMHNYHDNDKISINKAYELLKVAMNKNGLSNLRVTAAAEHMIDDNFENLLLKNEIIGLGNNHLLIEMSYLQPSINFDGAVEKIKSKQLFPLLAHPERYLYFHKTPKVYHRFKENGIKLQLNMLSLSGYYGKEIQKIAYYLLNNNLIDFIGTDVHHMRHVDGLKKITLSHKKSNQIDCLIHNNINTFY